MAFCGYAARVHDFAYRRDPIAGLRYELLEDDGGIAGRSEMKPPSSGGVCRRVKPRDANRVRAAFGSAAQARRCGRRRKARS